MSNLVLPFEYFSGANVVLSIEDFPVSQAAAFSMQIQESKVPIYGYSSRHFDAVARGRILVSGSLIINYVHHDYLFELIQMALQAQDPVLAVDPGASGNALRDLLGDPTQAEAAARLVYGDYVSNSSLSQAFQEKYWDNPTAPDSELNLESIFSPNPHDSFGGLSFDVTFGERSVRTAFSGVTGFKVHDVYFLGRGMSIQIDENTVVEEYSWIGRNLTNLPPRPIARPDGAGEPARDPSYTVA